MKAFVTDGDQRPALAIVRSLGRRGVSALVGAEHPVSLASSSKYCVRHVTYPSPELQPEAFRQFLLEFVAREKVDVIVPVTDVTTHWISLNRDALGRHSAIAAPPFEAFDVVTDKWSLLQRATRCGIPIPRTHFVDGIAGLKALVDRVEYPAVVKPVRSKIPTNHGWLRASAHYAHSEIDLWRLYEETDYLASYPSLIQERIVGPGLGVFVLFDHGQPLTAFAHRRLREKPPSGGVSVLCESVALDPRLKDYATRMLAPLGWHGVAMMEFKQDGRTGNAVLMEVNGRPWGSLQLAVDAGVDFPYLSYQLALGHRPDVAETYRLGVKSRWLLGDLDHLLLRLFHNDRDLHLPDSAPSKVAALVDFLKFAEPGLHYDVASSDDPNPFRYEACQYAKALWVTLTQRVSRRAARIVRAASDSLGVNPNTTEADRRVTSAVDTGPMTSQGHDLSADAVPRSVGAPRGIRICHIMSADLWAGAEVQLATVASYLVERPDVNLTAVLLNEGPLARELRRLGVQVTVVDETQNSAVRILTFLTRFLRDRDVEIVHTHRYKDNVLGSIAAKLAGVPHVVRTVHGLREPTRGWEWAKARAYDALDKATLRCFADRIIAVSKRMAETLRDSGHRPTAVIQIHNGVDLRKVRATRVREEVRRELGLGSRTLLVGTVGRLSRVKGHACFLRAAKLILEAERDARFLIVGDGPLRDELVASATHLGVDRACLFLGPRTDIYDLVGAMDIFVLPSLDEGIPMALLEAMALRTPVVAAAVGGVPELITHRATGLLVTPRDERALADACLELALNPNWAQTLGARARRVVEDAFSHERNGQALMEVYRSVTSGRASRATLGRLTLPWRLAGRLVVYGQRGLEHVIERRRMNRLRHDPTVLTARLKSARRILIVCHGNVIRSPFAAGLIAQAVGDRGSVSIASAGLQAVPRKQAHPTAVLTATALRVDLSRHAAAPVAPATVANADVILVMDIPQLVVMRTRFPNAHAKTFLLTCLAPEVPLEIPDPVDGDGSVFQICFDHISRAVRPIVRILSDTPQSGFVADPGPLHATERLRQ